MLQVPMSVKHINFSGIFHAKDSLIIQCHGLFTFRSWKEKEGKF